ncbi:hypothetical protein A3A20_02200 [Candidatus Wolfebacteria bacterium RIFCSPLOWO2_01_FULL_45_19]|uniref:Uncharacterized protein n=1 Tax=Candidatus Wolfebacteria bacterium RIFCSPLOWO2_01_FULL_45_19 TaxID=1802557 RepID=A0A1F8DT07_9BACT|nr:MAG: Secreted protein [Parcubacteria group bacterium GW2011_GWB1_45_9]OGM91724.1 MAG: hypothetical protein A3A20_02200 [Candidatus Wolfebacteria bacterium RIFCSPLOWO2_01_FULL_45_19]
MYSGQKGFTLIELLIYISIFAVVLTAFMAVFVQVLRVQNRQTATTEVINQAQFLTQRIQQLVRQADAINIQTGTTTPTLVLAFASSSLNPTTIREINGKVTLQQGTGAELELSSDKVIINQLNFSKCSLPTDEEPFRGMVFINLKLSYDSGGNPQLDFSQVVRSSATPLRYKGGTDTGTGCAPPGLEGGGASETTNIDSTFKYAWSDYVGWLDFRASGGDVIVASSTVTGKAWNSNIGWIYLDCTTLGSCAVSFGVTNDGNGTLANYAWNDEVGWLSFNCSDESCTPVDYKVTINTTNGDFSGWAWNDNIGWVSFNCVNTDTCGTASYKVNTTWRP